MAQLTTAQQSIVSYITVGALGIPPGGYMEVLSNILVANGGSYGALVNGIVNSDVFQKTYPTFLSADQFARKYATALLGPTHAGLEIATDFMTAKLNAGVSRADVVFDVLTFLYNAKSDATFGDVATKLDNQATVAAYYTIDKQGTATDLTTLQAVLSNVTKESASIDAAKTAISTGNGSSGSAAGNTFTLTTGVDNIVGTSGNDTINGSIDLTAANTAGATSTLSAADQIKGGAGTDTLNITYAGAFTNNAGIPVASISEVEVINVRNVTGNALTGVDLGLIAGVTEFNADRSNGAITVINLASGASAGLKGDGTIVNADFSADWVADADAAVLNLVNGTKGGDITVTGTGIKSLTVNSTGAANTIDSLTGAASTTSTTINATTNLKSNGAVTNAGATLTIKGAGAVDISAVALQAGVTKVDASANTGGVTVALGSAVDQTVTGGSGNDVITSGAVLTTGSVDAGNGTDTLVLGSNVSHANTAALAAKYTNFETLRVNGTFDASLIAGITAIELSGATNSITKMTAAQAAAVTARANIGNTTLALATDTGTADVLSLTMGTGLTNSAATTAGALTINGFETLNVKTNAGPTATAGANKTTTIGSFVADKLTAINLTGTAVTLSNAATTKAVTIDASQLTGDGAATPVGLTISGNLVAGSTVTGSGVKDVFNLGTVGSTYNAGAGNDTFAATAVTQLRSGATYNTLNGGDGTDTLTITSAGAISMVDDDFKAITNIEKITLDGVTSTGAADITVTTGGWYDASFKAAGSDLTIKAEDGDAVSFTGGTFSGVQKLTVETAGVGDTTADNVTVLTGSGNDTVTVTASSWVGHATTNGAISIATGAGSDTISLTTGTLLANANAGKLIEITGGTGADTITVSHTNNAAITGNIIFNVAAGDSAKAAFDSITGFKMSDIGGAGGKSSDGLNFGTAAISATVAATAVSGFAASELTYAINGTTGEVTFDGSKKADLTVTQVLDILDTVVANGKTVFWTTAATGGDTYVYNADATGDSVVKLVGVNADALITTNDATTDNGVFIL